MDWRTFVRPVVTLAIVIALTEASLCGSDDDLRRAVERCRIEAPNVAHDWTASQMPLTVRYP
jgi:hypothetical protein